MIPTKLHVFEWSKRASVWTKVVQICGVVACLCYFTCVTCVAARGLQCRKRPAKDGRGENRLATCSFKTTITHVIIFFAAFPVVKQKYVEGNTGFIGFPSVYLVLTSVVVVIANFWTRWWLRFAGIGTSRVVKCRISSGKLNPQNKKV